MRSKSCALQDVVLEHIGDNIFVVVLKCVVEGGVGNFVECIIVGSKDLENISLSLERPEGEHEDELTVTPWYEGNCNKIWGYFCEIESVSHPSTRLNRMNGLEA